MALYSSQGPHKLMKLQRRALGPKDVAIELHYCGVCHSDVASSQIGGIRETQELVHFCALHRITPEITRIPREKIDDAWTKVVQKEARYRFVIDMTNT